MAGLLDRSEDDFRGPGLLWGGGRKYERSLLYPGEDSYFKSNPGVSGMASESGHVVLNPYSDPSINMDAVYKNELARLLMRGQLPDLPQVQPAFGVTPEQSSYLAGTTYANAPLQDQRETLAARLFSGDSSAGTPTGDQTAFVSALARLLAGQ